MGKPNFGPSWRSRRHGLHYAMFLVLLLGFLMHVQPNCMTWIFEYVATYATACSLLPPCEPTWSWPGRPAALGEKEASCAMRQAPAVSFSSGELLLLSRSHVWNGVSDFLFWFFILVTVLCFRSLMEGIAAMWMDNVRKSLARKLLPRFCLSSARSQVREPSALRVHSFKAT